jgi:hypothetical protein
MTFAHEPAATFDAAGKGAEEKIMHGCVHGGHAARDQFHTVE